MLCMLCHAKSANKVCDKCVKAYDITDEQANSTAELMIIKSTHMIRSHGSKEHSSIFSNIGARKENIATISIWIVIAVSVIVGIIMFATRVDL